MEFVENSTRQTFFEQHTTFGGGSSSTSRNQYNAFIQPSGGPVRYLREHESGDTGRHVNFLRNNIDPQSSSLGDSIREVGHRDDPIVIEGTSNGGGELGKINCGREFHFQCIRKWLKRNNSCPICRRIALTP
ncbi:uncharacterized protein [Solanum tuberosum]|uniref:uncharacterized protein n=1 Tax=Solanum tuberosum TaxID=4113 RepID=UPI00073A05D7|nr:PREDICTED: uncharacterized protein LOC107063256 [Solanum tuberosum]